MRHAWFIAITLVTCIATNACSDRDTASSEGDAEPSSEGVVTSEDAAHTSDGGPSNEAEHGADSEESTSLQGDSTVAPPNPTLLAGFGESPLGFPLGTSTVGYGPRQGPKTPYSESYPGTSAEHTALRAKAMVLTSAGKTLALVRLDLIGVWQDMVRDAQARLKELGHDDLAEGLIVAATHTHRSGGRVFDHFIGEIAVGPFLEGFYPRVRDAIVNAAINAKAALLPARIGHTTIQVPELHSDRRCEHNDAQDDTMGVIKVEDLSGALMGVVVNYAMHGTVLSNGEFVLSTDAPGAIEDGVEAALPSPAPVLYLQSWAGDMAPEAPDTHFVQEGHDLRESYAELRAIGAEAAAHIIPALEGLGTEEDAAVEVVTAAVPMSNQLINPQGDFEDYPFGGIYCMGSDTNCGPEATPYTPAELTCVPIPEEYTVSWTLMSAARIGGLALITLPGEPMTSIGTELRDRALEATGLQDVFVVGYGQSYLSYLLHPEDYWMAGYEGASALMGPGFGAYLIESGVALSARLIDPSAPLFAEEALLETGSASLTYAPLSHEAADGDASVVQEPTLSQGVWTFSWRGGDPAIDSPRVSIEVQQDGIWQPARYDSGRPIDSRGPEIEASLITEPSYSEALSLESRSFIWSAKLPHRFAVPGPSSLQGTLRFVVQGQRPASYMLESALFER